MCGSFDTYDLLAIGGGPGASLREEIRISGKDRHLIGRYEWEGEVGHVEFIRKDGVIYTRESTESAPDIFEEWQINGDGGSLQILFCYEPLPGDGPDQTLELFLSEEEGTMMDEYWVDETGRPIRNRRTFKRPDGAEGVLEITYSGHGEPNVITAPIATPTPSS